MTNNLHDPTLLRPDGKANGSGSEAHPWSGLSQDQMAIGSILGGGAEEQKSPLDHLRSALRRKWTILTVFVAVAGLAVAHAYTAIPYYLSSAQVEIEKGPADPNTFGELLSMRGGYDLQYQNQIDMLKSRYLAAEFVRRQEQAAAQGKEIRTSQQPEQPTAQPGDEDPDSERAIALERSRQSQVDSLLGRVVVVPITGTQSIEVKFGASDPLQARRQLHAYLDTYIELNREKKSEVAEKVRTWLQKELAEADTLLKQSEKELLEFAQKHGIQLPERHIPGAGGVLEKKGRERYESEEDWLNLEQKKREQEGSQTDPGRIGKVQQLRKRLEELEAQYAQLRSMHPEGFPTVMRIKYQIEMTRRALRELDEDQLRTDRERARQRRDAATKDYDKTKEDAMRSGSVGVQLGILQKGVEINERRHTLLQQKAVQADVDQGVLGQSIVIRSAPSIPTAPVSPRKDKIIMTGVLAGILAGLGLAFCLEILLDRVRSTQELQRRLRVPVLGVIPKLNRSRFRNDEGAGVPHEFLAHKFPTSAFADAIRIVQDAASAVLPGEESTALAISSALPMEGKTLLAVVMGTVFASEGKRVVIIDGDLRKPRVHKVFGTESEAEGLSSLLSGNATELRHVIRGSDVPGLYYITAGPIPDDPVTLVKSDRMEQVIAECRKIFDVVILDTSPILGAADARILASYTDGMILVSRAGHTPMDILKQAKEALADRKVRLLGVVLNMADQGSDGYSRYYRKYYYGRRSEEGGRPSAGNMA